MHRVLQDNVTKAEVMIEDINKFHNQITKHWTTLSQRIFGFVLYSPPISLATGPKQFAEDWALINLYRDKIDWSTFKGNVIYLGLF